MTSGSVVPIVIGCDADPDREALVGAIPAGTLAWRGLLEGIPALKAAVADLRDGAGNAPRFTWLVRADEQVRAIEGSYAWVAERHGGLLRTLADSGDEIGWHPHFWRLDDATKRWYQETEDLSWQLTMLRGAHQAMVAADWRPRSVRMGWTYHSVETFTELDALGVEVEFSALPGLRTYIGRPPRRSENLFDWTRAPDHTYRAARADHQRAARSGEAAVAMLEVPVFVARGRGWGFAAGAQLARKTGQLGLLVDAVRRPSYFISVTARPRLFRPMLDALVRAIRRAEAREHPSPLFATYFHPDELLPNRSSMYASEHVRENLNALLAAISAAGARAEFVTAADCVARCATTPHATA